MYHLTDITHLWRMCGVYVLYRNAEVIYVGQSIDVLGRIAQHYLRMKFDCVKVHCCAPDKLLSIESELITLYQPKHNKAGKAPPMTPAMEAVVRRLVAAIPYRSALRRPLG